MPNPEMQIVQSENRALTLEELAEKSTARQRPIRVRLQPSILDAETISYRGWPGVSLTVDLADLAAVEKFREALEAFYLVCGEIGPTAMLDHLRQVQQWWAQRAAGGEK